MNAILMLKSVLLSLLLVASICTNKSIQVKKGMQWNIGIVKSYAPFFTKSRNFFTDLYLHLMLNLDFPSQLSFARDKLMDGLEGFGPK